MLLGLAVVAVAGCEAGSAPASTLRDSLGVTIVESTAPSWAEGDEWRIEEEPVVDLAGTGSTMRMGASCALSAVQAKARESFAACGQ